MEALYGKVCPGQKDCWWRAVAKSCRRHADGMVRPGLKKNCKWHDVPMCEKGIAGDGVARYTRGVHANGKLFVTRRRHCYETAGMVDEPATLALRGQASHWHLQV